MKTKYIMREVCAWSVTEAAIAKGTVEHRYVEIHNEAYPSQSPQVIELPTTEAIHLCASMASPATVQGLLSQVPVGSAIPSFGGLALPMIAQLIASGGPVSGTEKRISTDIFIGADGSFRIYGGPGFETDYYVSHLLRKAKDEV